MTFAWVIVHRVSQPGAPIYWTGARHRAMQWSHPGEWEQAVRFSRKEDAEAIAIFAGFYEPNPTHPIEQHGFECDTIDTPDLIEAAKLCVRQLIAWMKDHGEDRESKEAIAVAKNAVDRAELEVLRAERKAKIVRATPRSAGEAVGTVDIRCVICGKPHFEGDCRGR